MKMEACSHCVIKHNVMKNTYVLYYVMYLYLVAGNSSVDSSQRQRTESGSSSSTSDEKDYPYSMFNNQFTCTRG